MRKRRVINQMNVVPYIDVMLVLLVIFMVTAPMMPSGTIDLPKVGQSTTPPTQPLEVLVHEDGSLGLRDRAGSGNEEKVSRDTLLARLRDAQARHPDQAVLIAGDKAVRYEAVLGVMDELQRAQVARIGLLVHPGER